MNRFLSVRCSVENSTKSKKRFYHKNNQRFSTISLFLLSDRFSTIEEDREAFEKNLRMVRDSSAEISRKKTTDIGSNFSLR